MQPKNLIRLSMQDNILTSSTIFIHSNLLCGVLECLMCTAHSSSIEQNIFPHKEQGLSVLLSTCSSIHLLQAMTLPQKLHVWVSLCNFMCFLISWPLQINSKQLPHSIKFWCFFNLSPSLKDLLQFLHVKEPWSHFLWAVRCFRVQNVKAQISQVWLEPACLSNENLSWKHLSQRSHWNCRRVSPRSSCDILTCISSWCFLRNIFPQKLHDCLPPKWISFSCRRRLLSLLKLFSHLSHECSFEIDLGFRNFG